MLINILVVAVILLAIITAVRLMKVFEWTSILRGKKPYDISEDENNLNAVLVLLSMVSMFAMFWYLTEKYYNDEYILPIAASKHGVEVDNLMYLNMMVITIVFFMTQTLLLWFAYRYRYSRKRRALHYAHNNKLELVWTIIPAIVLSVLVLKGLMVWNDTSRVASAPDRITIELYAKQFEWTARYAGNDQKLGEANYCMINADNNPLGLVTVETIDAQLLKLQADLHRVDSMLTYSFPNEKDRSDLLKELRRRKHQYQVVSDFKLKTHNQEFISAYDDVLINSAGKIVLPVGREIELKMRSQDVIHSAYLPHFRVHMYCVPGVETYFTFEPTITTKDMRDKLGKDNFNYILLCNNICGASHFGMQMGIEVVTQEEYDTWWKEQKTFREAALGDTTAIESHHSAALLK